MTETILIIALVVCVLILGVVVYYSFKFYERALLLVKSETAGEFRSLTDKPPKEVKVPPVNPIAIENDLLTGISTGKIKAKDLNK